MIDRISELNRRIAVLKDQFLEIQNDLNLIYWPRLAENKRKIRDYKWYFLMSVCLFAACIIAVIAEIIRNEYLIGGSLALTLGLVVFLFIVLRRCYKKRGKINEAWDKEKKPMNEKKDEMDKLISESKELMIEYITREKGHEIIDEIGDGYDDLLEYYNHLIGE